MFITRGMQIDCCVNLNTHGPLISPKALCLNSTALGKTTTGQIVNLLSNDVNKFDEVGAEKTHSRYLHIKWHCSIAYSSSPILPQVTIFLHFLWVGPLQAAAVMVLLWYEIGPSCLAGMAVLVFLMPIQTLFGRLFSSFRYCTCTIMYQFKLYLSRAEYNKCWPYCEMLTYKPLSNSAVQ